MADIESDSPAMSRHGHGSHLALSNRLRHPKPVGQASGASGGPQDDERPPHDVVDGDLAQTEP